MRRTFVKLQDASWMKHILQIYTIVMHACGCCRVASSNELNASLVGLLILGENAYSVEGSNSNAFDRRETVKFE